jgi:hypothetical protein
MPRLRQRPSGSWTVTLLWTGAALLLSACTASSDETSVDAAAPFDAASSEPADASAPIDASSSEESRTPGGDDATPDADVSMEIGDGATVMSGCASLVVGPAGGTVVHPSGAQIVVPVGALAAATSLSLCAEQTPAAGLLGAAAVGPAFQAGPDGQTFLVPVEVVTPFDPTRLSAGSELSAIQMRMSPSGATSYGALQSTVDLAAGLVHAPTTHFTRFVAAQTPTPVFITTSPSLPTATVGVAYSQSFAASGGMPPYTWTVPSSTALPPGLSLSGSGVLGGTPAVPNNYAFFVEVVDSANDGVEMAVSLTVNPANNPVPALAQIAPSTTPQGSADTVITLSGTGFVPTAQALWDGTTLPTTFVGPTQLAATVAASDLLDASTHQVSVLNPLPGGGISAPIAFTVTPATLNPVPSIVSVSPTQLPIASVDVQVSITGSNFIAASSATIGSQGIATSYVSATQLLAAVPAAYLSGAGTLQVGVFNPTPGGGFSPTTVTLAVGSLNPTPTLTTLAPPSVSAGSGAFTLSLSGSGFASGAQAFFGSTALATTYMSSVLAQAAVPAYLVATSGNVQIVIVNPAPGGGASGAVSFAIATPGDGGDASTTAGGGADDAGDASLPPPGTVGGTCLPSGCTQSSGTQVICSNSKHLCVLAAGNECSDSSQCDDSFSCVPSACGGISVCATIETNASVCSVPGVRDLSTLSTCAPGSVCQNTLLGYWSTSIPMCGGVRAPCITQTIPAGGSCDIDYAASATCVAGLRCLASPADAGAPFYTCQ